MRKSSPAPFRILTYGYDAVLLDTRRLLLNQAGYETDTAVNALEFEAALASEHPAYELLVLCHTVPQDEEFSIATLAERTSTAVYKVPALIPPSDFLAHISALLV